MNERNMKKVDEMKALLKSYGFREDRWGNMRKTSDDGRERRYKFGKMSYRSEVKLDGQWVRIGGCYYKNIVIKDGKICGKK